MPERDGYIPGVPCWVDTSQPDPEAALDFYGGLFGWEFEDVMPAGSEASTSSAGSAAATWPPSARSPRRAADGDVEHLHLGRQRRRDRVEGPRCRRQRVMEPFDVMDAGRMAVFTDPEGAVFCVWQAKEHKGAQIVNEHGSLNFNGLQHPRRRRRQVVLRLGVRLDDAGSAGGAEMWTLPGYGDHLEQRQPRAPRADGEMGAPKGFEDVVAAINPIADDQPDTPRALERDLRRRRRGRDRRRRQRSSAARCSCRRSTPPWVRMTVIADPQGATFIASKFVPENKDL